MLSAITTKCWVKAVLPDDKLPQPQEMLNSRYKSRPLASHGTPWRYSKTAHRCDTRRHGRIAPIRRALGCPPAARDWTTSEIEKHQGRRFPAASIEQAFSILRLRVSGCLAESIQLIKSLRSIGVRSLHLAFAFGSAARALRRSVGTLGSDSSPA